MDNVNHPPHYTAGGFEAIDVIASKLGEDGFIAYCHGNALKYLLRCRYKGKMLEDLSKARWYITAMIEQMEKDNAQ
jgi:hypothetical protein